MRFGSQVHGVGISIREPCMPTRIDLNGFKPWGLQREEVEESKPTPTTRLMGGTRSNTCHAGQRVVGTCQWIIYDPIPVVSRFECWPLKEFSRLIDVGQGERV